MKQAHQDRLKAWFDAGMPSDDESLDEYGITMADIKRLQKRLMSAVAEKMMARPDVTTFAEHRTLQ